MTTEFTKLNSKIITPLMKSKGYKKIGKYDYGATFDQAVYKTQEKELKIIYTTHPYDYPYHGINVEMHVGKKEEFNKHYSFESGTLEHLLELLAKDINEGAICT